MGTCVPSCAERLRRRTIAAPNDCGAERFVFADGGVRVRGRSAGRRRAQRARSASDGGVRVRGPAGKRDRAAGARLGARPARRRRQRRGRPETTTGARGRPSSSVLGVGRTRRPAPHFRQHVRPHPPLRPRASRTRSPRWTPSAPSAPSAWSPSA